jgi:hypothetical protein
MSAQPLDPAVTQQRPHWRHGQPGVSLKIGTRRLPWYVPLCLALPIISIGFTAFGLLMLVGVKNATSTQIQQLGHTVGTVQTKEASNAASTAKLGTQVNGLGSLVGPLLPLGVYIGTCATDLTGPKGPAVYYFACTDKKPGG